MDAQAGEEAFQSILIAHQSGASIAHDVGFLAYGSAYDARFLLLTHEMIGRVRRMWSEVAATEEKLALDVIDEVARASVSGEGPTIYLKHPHTAREFRDSLYLPPHWIERRSLDLANPKETLDERLAVEVERLLAVDAGPTIEKAVAERLRHEFA
jgi:trimethylamine--corrinoid protein Co-methyltransferase